MMSHSPETCAKDNRGAGVERDNYPIKYCNLIHTVEQGWATLMMARATIFSHLLQGATMHIQKVKNSKEIADLQAQYARH